MPGANLVCDIPENDGDDRTTTDGGDEEGCSTLGVATKTTERERKYDGEDAGFEELRAVSQMIQNSIVGVM